VALSLFLINEVVFPNSAPFSHIPVFVKFEVNEMDATKLSP